MNLLAETDDESREGHCPKELGIIRLNMWRVNSFDVDDDDDSDDDNDGDDDNDDDSNDDDDDDDDEDKEVDSGPIHERDAEAKGAEHRIMCV